MEVSNHELEKIIQKTVEVTVQNIIDKLNNKPDLMTREEVMKELKICRATLWRWEKDGRIKPAITAGGKALFARKDVLTIQF